MRRKTEKTKRPLLDLEIKLKAYKKKGEKAEPRVLFSAGIPQFFQTAKDRPYGEIPLYDDMTEKDVIQTFRAHKKERQRFLAQFGNSKRRYITSNVNRDHLWAKMVKRYKKDPYKKTAIEWAKSHVGEAVNLFAAYLWSSPNEIESPELKDIQVNKGQAAFLEYVIGLKPTDEIIRQDFEEYIQSNLPKVIRPAVLRYTSARK